MKFNISILGLITILAFSNCNNQYRYNFVDIKLTKRFEVTLDSSFISPSLCLDKKGISHIIQGDLGQYSQIDTTGSYISRRIINGDSLIDFDFANCIQCIGNSDIVISDIKRMTVKYFDSDFSFTKKYRLRRYPIKFKILNNEIFYIADYIEESPEKGKVYGFKLFSQNLLTQSEEEIFAGNEIDIIKLRETLDFDNPGTIDFALFPNRGKLYCIRHISDKFEIHKIDISQKKEELIIRKDWETIPYNDSEKNKKLDSLEKIISTASTYPRENIKVNNKIAVRSIEVDPYGNIWTSSSASGTDSTPIIIFSPNGVLIKSFNIEGFSDLSMSVNKEFVVFYETDQTATKKISLYHYKFISDESDS